MTQHLNSATRLQQVLIKAESIHDHTPVVDAWASIFEITELNQNKKPILVSGKLTLMFDELENIRSQMHSTAFSEELYSPALSQIENTLSTTILGGSWNQVKQYLRPETFCSLAYCTEILPNEEDQISTDDIYAIQILLDELRKSLSGSQIPPRLKKLIEDHIKLIERALSDYQIIGIRALQQAIHSGSGEILGVRDIASANKDTLPIQLLGRLWKKISDLSDNIQKVDSLAQTGQKLLEMLGNIF